jgi:hypothetical protein
MLETQAEVEFTHDDIDPALAGSAQFAGKAIALATCLQSKILDCWTLTKPEVNFLIALATFTGFYLGHAHQPGHFPFSLLACTLVGTLLVASGTGTLNQYVERRFDAQMRRTAHRPLAAGRLKASVGLALGVILAGTGIVFLVIWVNHCLFLSIDLHPAKTKITGMYARRSNPRSDAAIDRLGRCFGTSDFNGMASLRHSVFVAIPPLHGDCLDVPRRLSESRLQHIAIGRQTVHVRQLDDCPAAPCSYPFNPVPGVFRERRYNLRFGSSVCGIRFSLSRVCPRSAKVESTRKTIAACIDRISPDRVRFINHKQ